MKRGDKLNAMIEHLRKFPRSTYEDLEKELGIDYNTARTYAERLRRKGFIEGFIGKQEIKVLKEIPAENTKAEFKEDVIAEMIQIYLDDIRECKVHTEKIRTGELVIRLLGIY